MKRAIIIHCWDQSPNYCWYPKSKKELEEKGFKVTVPEMPNSHFPQLNQWIKKLQETIGNPDEELYLIGHSLGCVAILRYLECLNENKKIGGVVMVAGFVESLGRGYEDLENFVNTPLDFGKIKYSSNHFVVIQSDNDTAVPLKHGYALAEMLGAKLIVLPNMDHFSGDLDNPKSIISLPIVTDEILKMSK